MRRTLALLTAFSVGVSGTIPVSVFAQERVAAAPVTAPAAAIDPIVLATFKAYPDGGQALTDRVRVLILQNNYLASDVARAIKANGLLAPAQRVAAEKGLAEAMSRLGVTAQEEAGLSGAQWAALVTTLAVGGGALGLGVYEVTKKVSPQ
jgi:hypothetical protein